MFCMQRAQLEPESSESTARSDLQGTVLRTVPKHWKVWAPPHPNLMNNLESDQYINVKIEKYLHTKTHLELFPFFHIKLFFTCNS